MAQYLFCSVAQLRTKNKITVATVQKHVTNPITVRNAGARAQQKLEDLIEKPSQKFAICIRAILCAAQYH